MPGFYGHYADLDRCASQYTLSICKQFGTTSRYRVDTSPAINRRYIERWLHIRYSIRVIARIPVTQSLGCQHRSTLPPTPNSLSSPPSPSSLPFSSTESRALSPIDHHLTSSLVSPLPPPSKGEVTRSSLLVGVERVSEPDRRWVSWRVVSDELGVDEVLEVELGEVGSARAEAGWQEPGCRAEGLSTVFGLCTTPEVRPGQS